jgi:hypothetical protein
MAKRFVSRKSHLISQELTKKKMTEHTIEIPCNTEVIIRVSCTERICGTPDPVIYDPIDLPILVVEGISKN